MIKNELIKKSNFKRALQEADVNKKGSRKIKMKESRLNPGAGMAIFKNIKNLDGNKGVSITYQVFDINGLSKELTQTYKWGTYTGDKLDAIWENMGMDSETQYLTDLIGEVAEVEIIYNKEFTNINVLAPMDLVEDDEEESYEAHHNEEFFDEDEEYDEN